jgi:polysaccharide export outer membrane protein
MQVAASLEDGYVLGVGDRLRLDIFNVPEYSGEFQVLVDGSLNLPVIGMVAVQGMTLEQASDTVATRFAAILQRPIVTLSLLEARPITIAIAGEVNHPGSYTLTAEQIHGTPSLTQAVQLAGGIRQSADIRQIQIRRLRPRTMGGEQVLTVNLQELLQAANLQQDVLLRDGDTILIPTATSVNLDEAQRLANANFAASQSEPIPIAVVGEVNRPGPYTLTAIASESNSAMQIPTVTQAIQTAGGITLSADIRKIQVRRTVFSGEEQVIEVDFWQLLQAGDRSQDLPLQAGDTIVVPAATALSPSEITELASASFSADVMTVNVVGEVARPGAVELPPNTPLNQALLAAGGFNNRARRGTVQLIRLNPDGTVSRRSIAIDFAEGVDADHNPPLRPNDTIVVGRSSLAGISDTLGTILSPLTGVFSLFRLLGL